MFALRSLTRAASGRTFSSSAAKQPFREKTFKENWLSDTGSYPVMVCIGFALSVTTTYLLHCTFNHPDTRIFATDRKALFRGDLRSTPLDAAAGGEEESQGSSANTHH